MQVLEEFTYKEYECRIMLNMNPLAEENANNHRHGMSGDFRKLEDGRRNPSNGLDRTVLTYDKSVQQDNIEDMALEAKAKLKNHIDFLTGEEIQ